MGKQNSLRKMGILTQAISDQRLRAAFWDLFLEEGDAEANTADAHFCLPLPQHTGHNSAFSSQVGLTQPMRM